MAVSPSPHGTRNDQTFREGSRPAPGPLSPRTLPAAGTFGPLVAVAHLGSGGFGTVYKVQHAQTGAEYALKVIRADAFDEDVVQRFGREMQVLAQLDHPAIVRIHGSGRTPRGEPYYFMDLLEGAPLSEVVGRAGKLPIREAASVVAKAARAVGAAHARGIIHRDLKPENIFVDAGSGDPRIVDFGLASYERGDFKRLTRSGDLVGTPAFMSPEQAEGDAAAPATDVWALGVVLFQAATGELPFVANGALAMLQSILTRPPRLPSSVDRALPAGIDEIFLRCCERKKEKRYPTALELAQDLEAFIRGEPITAKGRIEARVRAARRRTLGFAGAGLATAGLALGSVLVVGRVLGDDARRATLDADAKTFTARASEALAGFDPLERELGELTPQAQALVGLEAPAGAAVDAALLARIEAARPLASLVRLPRAEASAKWPDVRPRDAAAIIVGAELALEAMDPRLALDRLRLLEAEPPARREQAAYRARVLERHARVAVVRGGATVEERARSTLALLERGVPACDVTDDLRADVLVFCEQLILRADALLGEAAKGAGTARPQEARALADDIDLLERLLPKLGVRPPRQGGAAVLRGWASQSNGALPPGVFDPRVAHLMLGQLALERNDRERALKELEIALEISETKDDDVFIEAWKEAFCVLIELNRTDEALARVKDIPRGAKNADVVLARAWAWIAVKKNASLAIAEIDAIEAASRDDPALARSRYLGEGLYLRGVLRVSVVRPPDRGEALHDLVRAVIHEGTPARLRVRAATLVMVLEPRLRIWAERALAGDRTPPRAP